MSEVRLRAFDTTHRARALRASRQLVSDAEAEDLVQEALARSIESVGHGSDPDAQRAVFYRVMSNLASNQRRWGRVRTRWADALAAAHPTHCAPTDGDPMLRSHLCHALAQLSEAQRQVIELVYLEERTLDEAAVAMNRASGTVRSHLHRALATLRAALAPVWHDAAAHRRAPSDPHASRKDRVTP